MLQVLSPAGGAVGSCWTQEEVGRGKEAIGLSPGRLISS